jgi:predicted amidohydrolase
MRKPLCIAVAQPLIVAHDVAANALAHAEAVRVARARVVVFPELSLTGYELDALEVTPQDSRLEPLIEACAESGSLALAGAPIQGNAGRPHIAMLAIDERGARVAYRKMWLGAEEGKRFAPGESLSVLNIDGWHLGLAICKDTDVARHATDTAALGIDIYVAGTVKHDHEAAWQDRRARRIAIDHGVWVAISSCAGSTGGGYTDAAGHSAIWSSDGVAIARAGAETGAIARAELRKE